MALSCFQSLSLNNEVLVFAFGPLNSLAYHQSLLWE